MWWCWFGKKDWVISQKACKLITSQDLSKVDQNFEVVSILVGRVWVQCAIFFLGRFALRLGGLPAFDIILLGWCGGRPKNKPPEDQVSIPQLILSLQGFEEIRWEFFLFWQSADKTSESRNGWSTREFSKHDLISAIWRWKNSAIHPACTKNRFLNGRFQTRSCHSLFPLPLDDLKIHSWYCSHGWLAHRCHSLPLTFCYRKFHTGQLQPDAHHIG